MRSGSRPEFDALPVFDADGIGSGGPTPGARIPAGRTAAIAAVGLLVLLVAGVGLGGLPSGPAPTGTPTAAPAGSAAAVARTPVSTDSARPTPAVTPAVPCGTGTPSVDTQVFLKAGNAAPVPGSRALPGDPFTEIPLVTVGFGESVGVHVDGDLCAVAWEFRCDRGSCTAPIIESVANPAADPAYAAQNSWTIRPQGDQFVVADLSFEGGVQLARSWHVMADPFQIPDLIFMGSDGRYFRGSDGAPATATPGCPIFEFRSPAFNPDGTLNGYGGSCPAPGAPANLGEALVVQALEPVRLEIPSWEIIGWSGLCGDIRTDGGNPEFVTPIACGLGGSNPDANAPGSSPTPADPAIFVLGSDVHAVLQFMVTATKGGATFSVPYYASVDVR